MTARDTLSHRIRSVIGRSGVPSAVALREWADLADALELELDTWRDTASRVDGEFGRVKRELLDLRDNPRDAYHTMDELYEYRPLYNAHAAHGWLAAGIPVVKSWHHSDGEPCFGGGWFVVVATLPAGQVTNHYQGDEWHLFQIPEVSLAPKWDGHTTADAAHRLREAIQ